MPVVVSYRHDEIDKGGFTRHDKKSDPLTGNAIDDPSISYVNETTVNPWIRVLSVGILLTKITNYAVVICNHIEQTQCHILLCFCV